MSVFSFLGDLGQAMRGQEMQGYAMPPMPGPITGYGGGTFDMSGRQVTPSNMGGGDPTVGAQMPPMPEQPKRSGLRDFLGNLGDVFLAGAGADPIYRPSIERRDMGNALAQYLTPTDAALADIMRRDPNTGIQLLKLKADMQPKPQSPTALQQNIDYLRKLNPNLTDQQLAEVAQYAIAAPRMYGSPESGFTPDPNYPFVRGAGSQGAPQGGPQPGQVEDGYRFKGGNPADPNAWEKVGGPTQPASGGF